MTLQSAVALGGAVLLLGFVVFAFRQGTKVKPSGRPSDDGSAVGSGSEGHSGGDGGH
jgi:hypothetical protein